MGDLWIRGGRIVTAGDDFVGDVLVRGERIAAISRGPLVPPPGTRSIEAEGLWVLPGAIDPHVHLSLDTPAGPSVDDFDTGSAAALSGGTTTLLDFVTPGRDQELEGALDRRLNQAGACRCDYGLHLSVTRLKPGSRAELAAAGPRFPSVKTYLAYQDTIGITPAELAGVLGLCRELGLQPLVHAEQGATIAHTQAELRTRGETSPAAHPLSRPPICETEAVETALHLARQAQVPIYFVHLSARGSLAAIGRARQQGQQVIAETCPHYLWFDDGVYARSPLAAAPFVFSPPARPAADRQALGDALVHGFFQSLGTDHCPFLLRGQKDRFLADVFAMPNGAGGIELRPALLYTGFVAPGRLSPSRWVELISTGPAQAFGLFPHKGSIAPGVDADLVLWDPTARWTVPARPEFGRGDHSIYAGMELVGRPREVLLRGQSAFAAGRVALPAGSGRLAPRRPSL